MKWPLCVLSERTPNTPVSSRQEDASLKEYSFPMTLGKCTGYKTPHMVEFSRNKHVSSLNETSLGHTTEKCCVLCCILLMGCSMCCVLSHEFAWLVFHFAA